ncbi:hypothetical protein JQ559_26445 [Bradyrhizobium viridifuturi]|jgi:uncharacterized protein YjiS (DUF1127 family)|uniref:hypothetical protein n=1 Tax=Bradyrhizobium TaxID=374 RepID=UPI0003984CBE|nr:MULTISPECIES: hypothetical protein [Bradyrhizobium]ERF81604.1 MAG: hypothetical protein C207_05229 [Bradyrhizobium sp. DFCI-1]OYU63545.1 MAG: hypothetical protein CFE30_03400 [Bradyrhizobium sp. PARBB1]PSO27777.1 hypothetical protein C7G43_07390 [Bradyrhizobium sp. MOS004]QRI69212.1 hypothetical protein JQ507_30795 [Bradyrhizobium sp. PSBB068]MBR1024085.1 hypothetical protein [Bradyrhizobium viridifuturi]
MRSGYTRHNQTTGSHGSTAIRSPGLAKADRAGGALAGTATAFIAALREMFRLPAMWSQRASFRAQLRADLQDNADLLHDIGFNIAEVQAEAVRFFFEPVVLTRRSHPPDVEREYSDRRARHAATSPDYPETKARPR